MSFRKEDVPFDGLKMRTIHFNQKFNGKKLTKHSGLRSRYNIRVDPDLGVGSAAIRRIPCVCLPCIQQLNLPWESGVAPHEQPRYKQNTDCIRWNIFNGLNDWEIIKVRPGDPDDTELIESYDIVLEAAATRMIPELHEGTFIAISPEGGDSYNFLYVTSEPFMYKEPHGYQQRFVDESIIVNDMVVECQYMTKINRTDDWYYRENERYIQKVTHIVVCDILFSAASNDNRPPPPQMIRNWCYKLEEDPSNRISDKIQRQNVMEYKDYYNDSDDDHDVDT